MGTHQTEHENMVGAIAVITGTIVALYLGEIGEIPVILAVLGGIIVNLIVVGLLYN